MWPIKNFEKYFMAHKYIPKIFHDPHKNHSAPARFYEFSASMRHQIIQHNKFCLNKYLLTENEVQEEENM